MSKKKLGGIIAACIIGIIVVLAIVIPSEPTPSPPPTPPTTEETVPAPPAVVPGISRVGELAVFTEGPGLTVWFNLLDEDGKQVSVGGDLEFTLYSAGDKIVYHKTATIQKADFEWVERLFGGEKLLVYTWFIPFDEIEQYVSDSGQAKLVFVPAGQSALTPVEEEYVEIPKMSDEQIVQLYETRFQEAAQPVGKTISKENFAITLVRVGVFTHPEYETWGDEVTHLRADLVVKNTGSEKDYIFESDAVILDDLGNQYEVEWDGTLELGELHAGVKREGYLIFPLPEKEASRLRLLFTKSAYPEDITYEFNIQLP